MPPKDKKVLKTAFKAGTPAKDIIPTTIKNLPRESKPQRRPADVVTEQKTKYYQQYQNLEDWPGDEVILYIYKVAKNFDFGINSDKIFKQSENINVPSYFYPVAQESQCTWCRPKEIILDQNNNEFKTFEIFQMTERDETPQEFEDRKKLEDEDKKKQKKGPKKDESTFDDAPRKIKQCIQSNVDLSGVYPIMSRWIASCFQLIKDTGMSETSVKERLWNKIYPQNNEGIPIYNPSGRYWVKLYFRGKLMKIEIDDRLLFFNRKPIFPRCLEPNILWPMLFSKALIKLQENNWDLQLQQNYNHCDGLVFYALTGTLPEILSIKDFTIENFQYLKKQLSDQIYDNKDTILTCYKVDKNYDPKKRSLSQNQIQSKSSSQNSSPSSSRGSSLEDKGDLNQNSSRQGKIKEKNDGNQEIKNKEKSSYVVNSTQYYMIESFFNENFNMVYVKERNEDEIKLRQDYFNLCKQNIHKLSKEEKLEHRKLKKEQKERLNEEERKRQELISKPPVQYRLFSLKSKFEKVPSLQFKCPFTQKEIFIAKKCIINKLQKPPNYDITGQYQQVQDARGNDAESQTVINQDKSFEIKPLDEFNLPNIIEPKERNIKGSWIQDFDIVNHFDFIVLYHQEQKFAFKKFINVPNSTYEDFTKDEVNEILVIGEECEHKTVELFIAFQSNMVSNPQGMMIMPQFFLQKYDFNNFELIQNVKTLNRQFDGFNLQMEKNTYAFKMQTLSPVGFSLWINSNTSFQTMSIQQYITKNLKYLQKSFTIEHISGEKDLYMVFGKFRINSNEKQDLIVKIKAQTDPDPYLTKYLKIKLIKDPDNLFDIMLQGMEGVEKNTCSQTYLNITDYNKLGLTKGGYNMVIEGIVPFNVPEGKIEIDFFFKNEISIEQMEFLEPVEYCDKYIPNKVGTIFTERIFVSETVFCSFSINLVRSQTVASKDPKDPKKLVESVESEFTPQRLIRMELLEEEKVFMSVSGMNECWFSDVTLPKTDKNYYLRGSFDLREWSECKLQNEDTKDIQWYLRISGATNTVVLIKDTQKEERERAIQKNWEDKEPGRADKAKRARKKFKAQLKKERGEPLDQEEIAILNEPRLSKKQKEELNKQAGQQKGKAAPAKKETKKGADEIVEVKQQILNFPKSSDHHMEEITGFLQKMESDIIQNEYGQHQGEINTRSANEYKELLERLALNNEDFNSQLLRNQFQREKMKQYQVALIEQLIQQQDKNIVEFQEKMKIFVEQRNVMKEDYANKKVIKKQMLDIYTKEKPSINDIELVIKNAQETNNNEQFEIGQMLLNNARIFQILDELNFGVENFELQKIETNLDLVQQYKINVDQDLLEKAFEIADESKINPKYCEDKQNELKKGGKGKKK